MDIVSNFNMSANKFLDSRKSWASLADLKANKDILMPNGFLVYCRAENEWYQLNCTDDKDTTTYTWDKFKTEGTTLTEEQVNDINDIPNINEKIKNNYFVTDLNIDRIDFIKGTVLSCYPDNAITEGEWKHGINGFINDTEMFNKLKAAGITNLCLSIRVNKDDNLNLTTELSMEEINNFVTTAQRHDFSVSFHMYDKKSHPSTTTTENLDTWFANYTNLLKTLVSVPNVNIIAISNESEYNTLQMGSRWEKLITELKEYMKENNINVILTGAEFADTVTKGTHGYMNNIDVIGINWYPSIKECIHEPYQSIASFEECKSAMETDYTLNKINDYCKQNNKYFYVTEVGCFGYPYAYIAPATLENFYKNEGFDFDNSGTLIKSDTELINKFGRSYEQQANYYGAACAVLPKYDRCIGAFLFSVSGANNIDWFYKSSQYSTTNINDSKIYNDIPYNKVKEIWGDNIE